MAKRTDVLDHTVLGVLSDGPLHGYELRKRLTAILGPFRALSFGSLYPCLHRLTATGLIEQIDSVDRDDIVGVSTKRARIVYALTAEGKETFAAWVADSGPEAWEDEAFAARLAFFSRTEAAVRLRILEGRRTRLEERLSALQSSIDRTQERMDVYAERLQQHGIEGAEREVSWLEELIATERSTRIERKEARAVRKAAKKSVKKSARSSDTTRKRKP
jgi:DNA-binding PadR family transcriptional regulator